MTITVTSTTKTVHLDGVPARIWEGKTESGIPVHCYITRIAVDKDADCSQFDEELREHRIPSPEVQAIPLRLIL